MAAAAPSRSTDSTRDPDSPASGPERKPSGDTDRVRHVHVRFTPAQGRRLRRSEPTTCGDGSPLWTERPILTQRADGTYELFGSSTNLDGLARWVLSHGTDATVLGPRALRRRVLAEAHLVARRYDTEEG